MSSSICPDCETIYNDEDMQSGLVTPCPECYKCYVGECAYYSCDCGEEVLND